MCQWLCFRWAKPYSSTVSALHRSGISASDVPVPPALRRRQRQAEVWPAFFQDTVLRP